MIVKINISIWVLVALLSLLIKNTVERQSSLKMAIQKQYINSDFFRWTMDHLELFFSFLLSLLTPLTARSFPVPRLILSRVPAYPVVTSLPLSSTRHRLCSSGAAPTTRPLPPIHVSPAALSPGCSITRSNLSRAVATLSCRHRSVPVLGSASFIRVINA